MQRRELLRNSALLGIGIGMSPLILACEIFTPKSEKLESHVAFANPTHQETSQEEVFIPTKPNEFTLDIQDVTLSMQHTTQDMYVAPRLSDRLPRSSITISNGLNKDNPEYFGISVALEKGVVSTSYLNLSADGTEDELDTQRNPEVGALDTERIVAIVRVDQGQRKGEKRFQKPYTYGRVISSMDPKGRDVILNLFSSTRLAAGMDDQGNGVATWSIPHMRVHRNDKTITVTMQDESFVLELPETTVDANTGKQVIKTSVLSGALEADVAVSY